MGTGTAMDWMPQNYANQGRVLATGFSNGILRILLLGNQNFQILKAFKAHDASIRKILYSPNGNSLLTLGVDDTIFFFELDHSDIQEYEPLCLYQMETKINDLRWNKESTKVLITLDSGKIVELTKPLRENVDNHQTYIIEDLPRKEWTMKMMEFQMAKNQEKNEEEETRKRNLRLINPKEYKLLKQKEDEEAEKEWEPDSIQKCCYLDYADGTAQFAITVEGKYKGFLYICEFDSDRPLKAIPIPQSHLITYFCVDEIHRFLLIGFTNGKYEVRPIDNLEKMLVMNSHDLHSGAIKEARFSTVGNHLLSTGGDGIIFVYGVSQQGITADIEEDEIDNPLFPEEKEGIEGLKLEDPVTLKQDVNIDILDDTIYSIQQAKLRTEEDSRLKMAEIKKEKVRGLVDGLRKEFKEYLDSNLETKDYLRLNAEEMNIDPIFFEMLDGSNEEAIRDVKKELSWGHAWWEVALQKLKIKFLDVLEYDLYTVKGIRKSENFVRTFRLPYMTETLEYSLAEYYEKLEMQLAKGDDEFDDDYSDTKSYRSEAVSVRADQRNAPPAAGFTLGEMHQRLDKKLTKEERKKLREERKLDIAITEKIVMQMENARKNKRADDPKRNRIIEEAKRNLGDYKLKSSDKYEVPENERVNVKIKKDQMLQLEESMYKMRKEFNLDVEAARKQKKTIVEIVRDQNRRLRQINEELEIDEEIYTPEIDETLEYPEKFLEVASEDVTEYVKQKKKREKEEKAKKNIYGGAKEEEKDDEEDVEDIVPERGIYKYIYI